MGKQIWAEGNFRIIEVEDDTFDLDSLKGDSYDPAVNPSVDPIELKRQEIEFEREVEEERVYGYILERWNPAVGQGWEHIDSCFGFVGAFNPKVDRYNHYIVNELKDQIRICFHQLYG